jgi:hypothetical protein
MASSEVFTLFQGSAWQSAQAALTDKVNQLFDSVLTSLLIGRLAEHSVGAYPVSRGRRTRSPILTSPVLGQSVSDTAIQHMLRHEVSTNSGVPAPSTNALGFVCLPPGTKVAQSGDAPCTTHCRYRNDISGRRIHAVVPLPGCGGCTGGLPVFDAVMSTTAHELREGITDPIPEQGWYGAANGEIGDICALQTKTIGTCTVLLEWPNSRNRCASRQRADWNGPWPNRFRSRSRNGATAYHHQRKRVLVSGHAQRRRDRLHLESRSTRQRQPVARIERPAKAANALPLHGDPRRIGLLDADGGTHGARRHQSLDLSGGSSDSLWPPRRRASCDGTRQPANREATRTVWRA